MNTGQPNEITGFLRRTFPQNLFELNVTASKQKIDLAEKSCYINKPIGSSKTVCVRIVSVQFE
jgi:hypothetical protein